MLAVTIPLLADEIGQRGYDVNSKIEQTFRNALGVEGMADDFEVGEDIKVDFSELGKTVYSRKYVDKKTGEIKRITIDNAAKEYLVWISLVESIIVILSFCGSAAIAEPHSVTASTMEPKC